jgi:hypothetical protein
VAVQCPSVARPFRRGRWDVRDMKFLCTTDMPYHSDKSFPVGTDRYLVGQVHLVGSMRVKASDTFSWGKLLPNVRLNSEQQTYGRGTVHPPICRFYVDFDSETYFLIAFAVPSSTFLPYF